MALGAENEDGPDLVTSPPVVMAPRSDGAEIGWSVSRLCKGRIEFKDGWDTRFLAQDGWGFSPQGDRVLRVRLDGLTPGTIYHYRAVTEPAEGLPLSVTSEWRTFRTLDPAAGSTRFAVWNDTHDVFDVLKALDVATPAVDFLVWNGDACSRTWSEEELIAPALFRPGDTDFTAERPLAFSWGNHDVRGTYGFQVPDYIAATDNKPYYAFRSGPVAAVVLNTGEDKADVHPGLAGQVAFDPLRREQADWLERDVLTRPEFRDAPYRVVFCHIPLRWTNESQTKTYDLFSERSRRLWHKALVKWGAQVVISGHTHRAVKIDATAEFPYAQITGGGPKFDIATWIEGAADSSNLYLKVHKLTGGVPIEMKIKPMVV
jgi:hypothetical protein